MKTSNIALITNTNEADTQYGKMFYSNIQMENGDVGQIGKKKPNAIKIGDQLHYTLEKNQYGNKITTVMQSTFNGDGKPTTASNGFKSGGKSTKGSNASFALSYAKDVAVANIQAGSKPLDMDKLTPKIIAMATEFKNWMDNNK